MRDKVFTLKNHMDLKNEYFFENLQIPSFNLKRTIAQKIFRNLVLFKHFFRPPKFLFLTWSKEKLFFSFETKKEKNFVLGKAFKNVK